MLIENLAKFLLFLALGVRADCNGPSCSLASCTQTRTRTLRFVYYSQATIYDTQTVTVNASGIPGTTTLTSILTSGTTVTVTVSVATKTVTDTNTTYTSASVVTTVTSTQTVTGGVATSILITTLTTNPQTTVNLATINAASAIGSNLGASLPITIILLGAALFFVI